jgi:hypothetical protein
MINETLRGALLGEFLAAFLSEGLSRNLSRDWAEAYQVQGPTQPLSRTYRAARGRSERRGVRSPLLSLLAYHL